MSKQLCLLIALDRVSMAMADPLELGPAQKLNGGSFKATSCSTPALADFNCDGKNDLVVGLLKSNRFYWFAGK